MVAGSGFHDVGQGADVSKRAATDVLNVVDEHIDILQHLVRRRAIFAIERINGQSRSRVGVVSHRVTGMHIASHTMLRAKQSHQLYVLGSMQDVDIRPQVIVYSRRIGDQTDPQVLQDFEVLLFQNLYAGLHFLCRRATEGKPQGTTDE